MAFDFLLEHNPDFTLLANGQSALAVAIASPSGQKFAKQFLEKKLFSINDVLDNEQNNALHKILLCHRYPLLNWVVRHIPPTGKTTQRLHTTEILSIAFLMFA